MQECFDKGHPFRILEAYRSQARQNMLWELGRTKPGPKRTWTKLSRHTSRLAFDLDPVDGDFDPIVKIAEKYGISHPLPFDQFHFEVLNPVQPPVYSLEETIKQLTRAIQRGSGHVKELKQRVLARLLSRSSFRK